jgi:cell division protein FtsQ
LFIFLGTINNKNFKELSFPKIKKIKISGLSNESNHKLLESLDFLKLKTIFILNDKEIKKRIEMNNLVEKYHVVKKYPSSLEINIIKTQILAKIKKNDKLLFLGSNGKLIENQNNTNRIPFIFGDFSNEEFFKLKSIVDKSNFDYKRIKNLFFFKSGRWDLEINSGTLIKLPKSKLSEAVDLFSQILKNDQFKDIKLIDLRQTNQLIINER